MKIRSIDDVAEHQLCAGCGVCAYMQPDVIQMVDDPTAGRRPVVEDGASTDEALGVCPGTGLTHGPPPEGTIESLRRSWGPILEIWEGHAADDELRFSASSGGVSSALAIHAIEQLDMHGLLHIRAREDRPYLNTTVLSTTAAEIRSAVGSRYAPASPGDGLGLVEAAPGPCVMIGKPCDIAGAASAARRRPRLQDRLGLTIAVFCAGTPTLAGTMEMLASMGIAEDDEITELRYRGNGWPGHAKVTARRNGKITTQELTYDESWNRILQRHRQWRCYVCADHTGEFADISVGDPWYREQGPDEPGRSIILVRTERGRRVLQAAMDAGVIHAEPVKPRRLPDAQPWLGRVRGSTGGRIAVLRLLRVQAPRYVGLPMWHAWWSALDWRAKLQSTVGTATRIRRRGLRRPRPVVPLEPPAGLTEGDPSDAR